MEQRISVIIPIYNAEKYLSACMDSLLSQTYENLEIILVDDGSKDGSLTLCRAYEQKDSRVRVIHQENQGVSAARNAGLKMASGAYIAFVDADDYVETDYFQRLYQAITESAADMACCDYVEILNGEPNPAAAPKVKRSRKLTDICEVYASIAAGTEHYWSCVWGKLIKADLAKKIAFTQDLRYGEDQVYMYDLFLQAPAICLDRYKGYYYVRNEDSATMRFGELSAKRRMDEMKMYQYMLSHLPQSANTFKNAFECNFENALCAAVAAIAARGTKEEMQQYRDLLKCEIRNAHFGSRSVKHKIHFSLFYFCPGIYRWMMCIKYRK